jgi:tetratricopeptide (TPR) repeat protein
VDALKVRLLGKDKTALLKRYTENTEAYHLYLKGRYFWFKSAPQEFRKSREYFERAVNADPAYALGYFGLASYYGFASSWGMMRPEEGWPLMETATVKALELDDTLAEVHHGLAALKWVYYRDWSGAEEAFRRALELNPEIAAIHSHYSIFLSVIGKLDDALEEGKRALKLDPLSIRLHRNQAGRFYMARRYDAAIRQYVDALELDPDDALMHEELGDVYQLMGRYADAITEWTNAATLSRDDELAAILRKIGSEEDFGEGIKSIARIRLERLNERLKRDEYVPAAHLARLYVSLGDTDEAFRWLEKARDERNAFPLLIKRDPFYDDLHADARFEAIFGE